MQETDHLEDLATVRRIIFKTNINEIGYEGAEWVQ